jgi:glycosyltransferase involved in cell wall biosynthesis
MIAKKVLFVHDGPMMTNMNKSKFYGVHYTDELINRYSFFGDKVSFLMRSKAISDEQGKGFSLISHKAFCFIEVPNFKSIQSKINQSKAEKIINDAVKSHDIIIVRLPSASGVIAKKIAEKHNKPILVEVVACVYDALWNYDWRGKLLAHYKKLQYQKHIKNSTHVLYVTNKFLQERYPTRGKSIGCSDVILNTIDTSILNTRLNKIQKNNEILVLGTVAAIDVPYKGQADIIKAIAILKGKNIRIKYKIVGQGDPTNLKNLIKKFEIGDLVEIIGPLQHEKVFEFIDNIDLYIQPSKQEGLPRAVIEAMSRACPVLGSNIAGIPELINKEALFEAGNLNAITKVLKKIDQKQLAQWAADNFNKAKEFKRETLDANRKEFYEQFKQDYNLKELF